MRPGLGLDHTVWAILTDAAASYRDSRTASDWLRYHMQRYTEPLRIAVAGTPSAGKSTLVNAMVGEEIAPIEAEDGTALATWYQDGPTPRASVYSPHGPARELPITRLERGLRVDTGQWQPQPLDRVVVDWPTRTLRESTLIDTPGRRAGGDEPAPGPVTDEADAVLYLTRHLHGVDLDFLGPTPEAQLGLAAPVSTIVVLSRADELGAGRIDALTSAKQIARRHHANAGVRAICQDVVAVSGMLALAGKTLRDNEFTLFTALAAVARESLAEHLLSAERFLGGSFPVAVDVPTRRALLEKFGIFGIRLASTLVRRGADTPVKLSAQLMQRSGLSELRESIGLYFTDRRQVLKARSALAALAGLARSQPHPHSAKLAAAVERALAGAHEFRELRLLARLQSGQAGLPAELGENAQRLAGGNGIGLPERLGLPEDTDDTGLRRGILAELAFWQDQAANPPFGLAARDTAQTLVRTCEAMLAALPTAIS